MMIARRTALLASVVPTILPLLNGSHRRVLDLGCGSNCSLGLLSLGPDAVRIGVDVGMPALRAAARGQVRYSAGDAHALPFASGAFDLVISKVALPYTDIPRAVREVHRVLSPGGCLWMTLHPWRMAIAGFLAELGAGRLQNAVYRGYVLVNGLVLGLAGREFRFARTGRIESFQSVRGIARVLARAGFCDVRFELRSRGAGHERDDRRYGRVFAVAACKPRDS